MLKYSEIAPSNNFEELIQNYWKFEVPENAPPGNSFVHEIMPDTTVSVVFINQPYYQGIRILGPQTKKLQQEIFPGSVYLGIRFNPWINISSVFGDKADILNRTANSQKFLKPIFREINAQKLQPDFSEYHLLEKGLVRLAETQKISSDPLVKYICVRLADGIKIKALMNEIPVSIRPVQKKFKAITGVTMACFRNIIRLEKTIKMVYQKEENITASAYKNGYADHSHFMSTFRKHMHTSIKEFLAKTSNISVTTQTKRLFTQ